MHLENYEVRNLFISPIGRVRLYLTMEMSCDHHTETRQTSSHKIWFGFQDYPYKTIGDRIDSLCE